MPIEAMYWDWNKRAAEVHVLPGTTSTDLRVTHLRVQTRDAFQDLDFPFAKPYMDAHPNDVTFSFTIADAFKEPGASTRTLPGVTVNSTTGEVTVVAANQLPVRFAQNFLIETVATSGPGKPFKELIRVHIHRSVQSISLTPGTLNIRPLAPVIPADIAKDLVKPRFALRARFDDGTVGDITDWPIVAWSSARGAAATTHVASDGRLTITPADVGAADITVTARLTGHPTVTAATATVHPVARWGPTAPIDVRLVPGGGWAKPFALEAVANVLFLPDGIEDTSLNRTNFFSYVNSLVMHLKTEPLVKPFDVLANSINFWAAFIPSATGVTWGSEVFAAIDPDLGVLVASAMPKPERPQDLKSSDKWELDNLIYEVGIPTPADRPGTSRTMTNIIADWDALFGTSYKTKLPTDADERDKLFASWRDLGTRRILDNVDTSLGVVSGGPRVDTFHDLIQLNPDRMDRFPLDDLMSAMRHDKVATSGLILNTLWTDRRKRNYDLVCIITAGPGREVNDFGYFMVAHASEKNPPCTVSGANDITVPPLALPDTAEIAQKRTFAHELCHSFSLGDEYGGTNDRPLFPADVEHADRTECNLQGPTSVKQAGQIHGDEIKWRWPRIQWAAEIIGPITNPSAGVFEAPIRWSHAFTFPIGKAVHLRFRDIHFAYRDIAHDNVHYPDESAYLVKLPKVSVPLRLVDTFEAGTPSVKHVRLRVDTGVTFPYPAAQTIQPAAFAATFTPGSIVYEPTPAPAGVFDAATYPYAELIAKNVKDHVTFLHAAIGDSADFPEIPRVDSMPLPTWFPKARKPLIVGLYEGGMGNDVGVFHPSGFCSMNSTIFVVTATVTIGVHICPVCRYVLVDEIDPSKHYFIDPEYTPIYPQR
jgi:hypothetical protein